MLPVPTRDFEAISRFIGRVGFPIVVTFILLFGLLPKIDHGVEVADRLDAKVTLYLQACTRLP